MRNINIKKLDDDHSVAVNVVPSNEQIIWTLRSLDADTFKQVVKAAKQYRKADNTLTALDAFNKEGACCIAS